jgi:hypothetical protein
MAKNMTDRDDAPIVFVWYAYGIIVKSRRLA